MPTLAEVVSYATKPTAEYASFQQAYDFFNVALFGGSLPDCLITLQRKRGARGYFWGAIFSARAGDGSTDEIAMNPETFDRTDTEIMSTLVHEMCHLWQHHHGKPTRNGYHNREWAAKMCAIGLIPSASGQPGGNMTGQRMTHYIDPRGPFAVHAAALIAQGFALRWQAAGADAGAARKKNKIAYCCAACGQKAWARPDAKLICGDCQAPMEAQQ